MLRDYQYSLVTDDETQKIACEKRLYQWSLDYTGALEKPVRVDIKECLGIVGHSAKGYGNFLNMINEIRKDYKKFLCGEKCN